MLRIFAVRFHDGFAPACGTVKAHIDVIEKYGYVWFGKIGQGASEKTIKECLQQGMDRILLIDSGRVSRWWAYIDQIQNSKPEESFIPEYYRDKTDKIKTWFRIFRFEAAPRNILSKYKVASSGKLMSHSSRCPSSLFIIEKLDI